MSYCKKNLWCSQPEGHRGECASGSTALDTAAALPPSVEGRIDLARLLIDSLDRMAAAGVRVLEMGEGASRVRVELEPASAPSLIRRQVHAMLRESAPDHPALGLDDPERADDTDQPRASDEGAATQAASDLDLAHLP